MFDRKAYMATYMKKKRAGQLTRKEQMAADMKRIVEEQKANTVEGGYCPGKGGPDDNRRLYLPICKNCTIFTGYMLPKAARDTRITSADCPIRKQQFNSTNEGLTDG